MYGAHLKFNVESLSHDKSQSGRMLDYFNLILDHVIIEWL